MFNCLTPLALCVALGASGIVNALNVTRPASGEVIAAGDDYATQVLGNAWDMSDAVDIDTEESIGVTNQLIGSGVFSGDTAGKGAFVYPLFMGYPHTVNLSRGVNFPIDTSHYRYVTIKIRTAVTFPTGGYGGWRTVFLKDGDSYNQNTFGYSVYYITDPNNAWQILTLDMISQLEGTSPHLWTEYAQVTGLRIEPATQDPNTSFASAHFDIDWIRLTAPATTTQKYTVQWTDSGFSGPYTITAVDSGGVTYPLGSGVSGTSYVADMTFLAPGQYTIVVARSGASAPSGTFSINTPPQVAVTAPSVRGDQSRDFATVVAGNAWGPFTAADFSTNGVLLDGIMNFTSVVYNSPAGSFDFYGRPTNFDPQWFLNLHGHTIDTSVYRSVCFKQEVFGPRSLDAVTGGSIARLFWGNSTGALSTSQDIVLDDNLSDSLVSEYCIPDLAAVPLVETNPPGGIWSGTKAVFRLDPDEFAPPSGCSTPDTCHDVRLDSVILSPFAQADPGYTFAWNLIAPANLKLYLDPDTTPGNGNEITIGTIAAGSGNGQLAWSAPAAIPYGTYHVLSVANDGINAVDQYAGGVIVVGALDGIFRNGFDPLP